MERYNPQEIEKRWQKVWQEKKTFKVDIKRSKKPFLDQRPQDFGGKPKFLELSSQNSGRKPKFYNLMMFPYPSGEGLHVGHVYAFGGADTFGRFKKMQGFDVFEPMGFDSFGINSENYAIKIGKHPGELIKQTTTYFRENQLKKLGALFDWDHEVITSDPNYYKWTQWLFVRLFKRGLAVRKKAAVDWCPSCLTVLADEQVIAGKCERCGTEVVQKDLEQWFFRITEYAERLLKNLDSLPADVYGPKIKLGEKAREAGIDWSETTKTMQRNWIGRSEGAEIEFPIKGYKEHLTVYTTRPDTVYGATFMIVAPEHPLVSKILRFGNGQKVMNYVSKAVLKTELERQAEGKKKEGVFTGHFAINPFTRKEIPIWIADYVLTGYGTGAIMAVPAHDQRDFEFTKKYKLPIIPVILNDSEGSKGDSSASPQNDDLTKAYLGEGKLVNSGQFTGQTSKEAIKNISKYIEDTHLGKITINYHLRDWLISRQRYWGPPIPMIHCEHCASEGESWFTTKESSEFRIPASPSGGQNSERSETLSSELKTLNSSMPGWYPVPEKYLPVELPELKDYQPRGKGVSPLATLPNFVNVKCPGCGSSAKRETDVSDTFLDSSWYFLRYPSVGIQNHKTQLPWNEEITKRWLPVDMYIGGNEHAVLHLMYTRFITMVLHDIGLINFEEPFKKFRAHGLVIHEGAKMSKSRGNVVNPNEFIEAYGADTLRMYLLFLGPYDQGGDFSDRAISGVYRFLNRVWTIVNEVASGLSRTKTKESSRLVKDLNKLTKRVSEDLENLKFNTAIAALMEFVNLMYENKSDIDLDILKHFLLLLAPFAPHISEELWSVLGGEFSNHQQKWPSYDRGILEEDRVTIVIQVNGRLRDKLEAPRGISKELVARLALDLPKVKAYTEKREVKDIIWVEGRLLNLVTDG